MKRLSLLLLIGSPLALTPALWADTIDPVVQYTSAPNLSDSRPFTLGYSFTTSTTFDINALGVWDAGLGVDQQVGIWDSTGNLLVSTTVSGSAADIDNFQWNSVSYVLAPGAYTIGATFYDDGASVNFPSGATGVTTLAGYSWGTDEQVYGSGLNFPTVSTDGGYGENGVLWADFSVGSSTATPEPSSLVLLGTGMLACLGAVRRKIKV